MSTTNPILDRFVCDYPDPKPDANMIFAYTRLGHKYQIEHLFNQAVEFLKKRFTGDLTGWSWKVNIGGYVPPNFKPMHAIGVVNIARLAGCPIMLPIALVVCCSLKPKRLLRGFKRADGSYERLDHEDLLRCLTATPVLMQKTTSAVLRAFAAFENKRCTTAARCQKGLQTLLHGSLATDGALIANPHPFHSWVFYAKDHIENGSICMHCLTAVRNHLRFEQEAIWKELPDVFHIDVEHWAEPSLAREPHQPAMHLPTLGEFDSDSDEVGTHVTHRRVIAHSVSLLYQD